MFAENKPKEKPENGGIKEVALHMAHKPTH